MAFAPAVDVYVDLLRGHGFLADWAEHSVLLVRHREMRVRVGICEGKPVFMDSTYLEDGVCRVLTSPKGQDSMSQVRAVPRRHPLPKGRCLGRGVVYASGRPP